MDNVKECSKCHEMEAHNRNGSKPDGLQTQCKKCEKAHRDKPENKERKKAANAALYEVNKEAIATYHAEPKYKEWRNAQMKERRKTDPVFRARECLRTLVRKFLGGISKSERTEELLGCSYEQFVEYQRAIASPEVLAAITAGVEIDHDHNIPLSVKGLDPRIESHRRAMCHYTNFFLLESLVNVRKQNHTPEGFNFAAWLEEQTARIAACEGKTPMETIEQNREYIDAAHAFADRFRKPSSLTP